VECLIFFTEIPQILDKNLDVIKFLFLQYFAINDKIFIIYELKIRVWQIVQIPLLYFYLQQQSGVVICKSYNLFLEKSTEDIRRMYKFVNESVVSRKKCIYSTVHLKFILHVKQISALGFLFAYFYI
jgi:hypothetical protein